MANKNLKYRFALRYISNGVKVVKDTATYSVSLSATTPLVSQKSYDLTTSSVELAALNSDIGEIGAVYVANPSTDADAEVILSEDDSSYPISCPIGKAIFLFWNSATIHVKTVTNPSTGVEIILFEE